MIPLKHSMILDLRRLNRIDEGRGGELRNLYRLGLRLLGGKRIRRSVPLGVRVLGSDDQCSSLRVSSRMRLTI